jgi:hypothetical protein
MIASQNTGVARSTEEIKPWMGRERLQPGVDWEYSILQAIGDSQMFILVVSLTSVSKDGFIKRKISEVLHVQERKPHGEIFVVPVRIDD